MLYKLGETIVVPEHHLVWANSIITKSEGQAFGLAIDEMIKHRAMRELQCTIPPCFSNYDLQVGDWQYEIKTTSLRSFTFSEKEYRYIRNRVLDQGQRHEVMFFINDIPAKATTYIGKINSLHLFQEVLFKFNDVDGSWYLILEHVENLLKALQSAP